MYALYQAYGKDAQKSPKTVCTVNVGVYGVKEQKNREL
jgi:hypothetical protein